MDAEADVSRFVNGHDRAEDDPLAGIYTGNRSGGINLLEKFMEWIGEKIKDVGRER